MFMYAVIYWVSDNRLYIETNKDGFYDNTLKLFETLKEADEYAEKIEEERKEQKVEARVISIEPVKE